MTGADQRFVMTADIRAAVKGDETDLLDALNVAITHNKTMIPTVVTFFDGAAARRKREDRLRLHHLADLIRTPAAAKKSSLTWLKLARVGDKRRNRFSVAIGALRGVVLDHQDQP